MRNQKVVLPVLLLLVSLGTLFTSVIFTSQATAVVSEGAEKNIVISRDSIEESLSVPIYKISKGKMVQSKQKLSILDADKSRLAIYKAKKVRINNKAYWKLNSNTYIDDHRVETVRSK
ncbi:hypothetical protein [Companilactobacillus zhongbaensis]|uniref:hypothetical protein n=1 Tax=Companilactobacillus zhongbaensis TaxID=2486009 RepID=UPI000F78B967|nr:hypothetical protein [Companilactobacillus zhongbaensis]